MNITATTAGGTHFYEYDTPYQLRADPAWTRFWEGIQIALTLLTQTISLSKIVRAISMTLKTRDITLTKG